MLGYDSTTLSAEVPVVNPSTETSVWSYEEAFKRNRGLITEAEQEKLRNSRVAIAGMGGVGGLHLITLARLGIGKFTIADPDVFDVANFNRQQGATIASLGRNKAEVMAEQALAINPELDIQVLQEPVSEVNIDDFLEGADLYVDGLDFFAIDARRLVFRQVAERGIWSVTAGPIGFSTAYLAFDPDGMAFDRYFDLNDSMDRTAMLAAFAVGLTPKATHLPYTDLSYASLEEQTGPSAALACQLATGVLASDAVRILLGQNYPPAAPAYRQFDARRDRFVQGRLLLGNRGPIQKLKRKVVERRFDSTSWLQRRREPDLGDNVEQYNRAEETKLAIAYALGIEVMHRCRPTTEGGKALDLACGPGLMSLRMAEFLKLDHLTGLDLCEARVERANMNAKERGISNTAFKVQNITNLGDFGDNQFDLCTFCDAAHHMIDPHVTVDDPHANTKDLEVVRGVLREMDRVTKPEGLVVLMDLVRFKSATLTEIYVALMGFDYFLRGLGKFYHEFRHSMYAAWSVEELTSAVPQESSRNWLRLVPKKIPSIQFVIGTNREEDELLMGKEMPLSVDGYFPAAWYKPNRLFWEIGRADLFAGQVIRIR